MGLVNYSLSWGFSATILDVTERVFRSAKLEIPYFSSFNEIYLVSLAHDLHSKT
jgi:hypothetical protein